MHPRINELVRAAIENDSEHQQTESFRLLIPNCRSLAMVMSGKSNRVENGSGPSLARKIAWIVVRVDIFQAERPVCGHLRDVFAGLRPVEVGSVARENDDSAGRIGL